MAYNQKFFKTESATARSLTSCAAGTRGVGAYTASAESIISQRDTDRKALVWAQAAAQSLVTCRYDPFATVSGLSVLPVEGLNSSGEEGGPFSPATLQYTILNFGNGDCNWQCNASEAWVTVSATSGFLYAGESVVIQIGFNAAALPVGTHTATLTFYNASKGIVATTRQVVLEVTAAPVTCDLTLPTELLNATTTPYADLATAQTAITDETAGCLVQQSLPTVAGGVVTLFTASMAGSTLDFARTDSMPVPPDTAEGGSLIFKAYLTAAGGLAIAYSLSPNAAPTFLTVTVDLYAESDLVSPVASDGDTQFDVNSLAGTFNLAVPSDGYYYLRANYGTGPSANLASSLAFTASCSSAGDFSVCRVRAAWDDGGGVNYEACT